MLGLFIYRQESFTGVTPMSKQLHSGHAWLSLDKVQSRGYFCSRIILGVVRNPGLCPDTLESVVTNVGLRVTNG